MLSALTVPPNDTIVNGVCDIPAPDTLLLFNSGNPLDSVFLFPPTDSTSSNGLTGVVDPCMQDTLYRTWSGTFADMSLASYTQRIIIRPDMAPPTTNPDGIVLDTTVSCAVADMAFDNWRQSRLTIMRTNVMDCSPTPLNMLITDDMPGSSYIPAPCDTLLVTFSLQDVCGNDTAYLARFITIDTVAPVLANVPAGLQLECDETDGYLANNPSSMVTATDDCTAMPNITFVQDTSYSIPDVNGNLDCRPREFNIRRIWTVADDCGNLSTAIQIIEVRDRTAPTFTVPPAVSISCSDDELDLSITGNVTNAMDNCGDTVLVSFTDQLFPFPGECSYNYQIRRQWRAEDVCGNATATNQVITVRDLEAPAFTVPADTTVNCGLESSLAVTGEPTMVADNCAPLDSLTVEILSETVIAGSCENNFTIERQWRVADVCGNDSIQLQRITVIDTIAPTINTPAGDLVINCMQGMSVEDAYNDWISTNGGALAADLCAVADSLSWSALLSGTGQSAVGMPPINCPANSDTLVNLLVDFVVSDGCGNSSQTTAAFVIIDDTPPAFEACPADVVVGTNFGQCSANFTLEVPFLSEACAASVSNISVSDNAAITSNAAPGQEGSTPVNPVQLTFAVSQPLPINAQGNGLLNLQLTNVDAEGATEYFRVIGEDGTLIGRSGRSGVQCGNADTVLTVPKPLLDLWAVDGVINITLEPNIPPTNPGSFAINDICEPNGSTVNATLSFQAANLDGLRYEYKVNGGSRNVVAPIAPVTVTLPIGPNQITYYATDCAGNVDSCSYQVLVEDQEAPQLACPADIAVPLDTGECSAVVTLPLPASATDNCGLEQPFTQTLPGDTASAWLNFTFDPNLNDYLASSKSYSFSGVAANAVGNVALSLDLRGDFSTAGAFFNILSETGDTLSSTPIGAASCAAPGQFTLSIPAASFNEWAADGEVSFTLEPNTILVPPGMPGDGINPCSPGAVSMDGQPDSLSYAFMSLTYQQVTPFYYAEGATDLPYTQMPLPGLAPEHEFSVGATTVYYVIEDAVGNLDTCSFQVEVLDNEPPVALCNATFVDINPSGLDVDTVSVAQFDAGSYDNCAIDTMFLSPNTFTCDQAETTIMATLTVIDVAGNTSTCTRPIRIEAEKPMPTYTSGICGGDTLYLFANPPAAEGGIVYSYEWRGPNGQLVSTLENPILPNVDQDDAGAYVLSIEGITGCIAEEVVNVDVTGQPLAATVLAAGQQCAEDPIVLNSSVVLNNATYFWYEGQAPNGSLVGTTNEAMIAIPPSNPGSSITRFFYVVIEANGCLSEPSPAKAVQVTPRPQAFVDFANTTVCEGGAVSLGSPVAGPGISYQWTGPDGFSSALQYPPVISPIGLEDSGPYQLTVTRNGCASNPAASIINVLPKPNRPSLAVEDNQLCEGETLVLRAEPAGAASYTWTAPDLSTITTPVNSLTITDADNGFSGVWTVQSTQFGCDSDMSFGLNVAINTQPVAMVSTNIAPEDPLCERSSLELYSAPNLPGASYMWTGPNGYTSVAQNPVLNQVGPGRTGTYTLRVTTAQGCTDTSSVDVQVVEAIDIIGVSNNATECLYGETDVVLEATVFPIDNGSYSYLWSGPGFNSTNAVATIPDVTGIQNGFTYSLTVFTPEGCPSLPASTTLQVKDAPGRLPSPVATGSSYTFCEGEPLELSTAFIPNATYFWITPAGTINTGPDPVLNVDNLTVNDAGGYQVYIAVNGCSSIPSPVRNVTVNAAPSVEASSNSPVCEGTQLQLFANGSAGATYAWSGPFTSAMQNPAVPSADPLLHSGTYQVVASRNGCESAPASVEVIVNETLPAPALLEANSPICIDAPGATAAVSVPNGSTGTGISYIWYNFGVPVDTTVTPNLLFNDFGSAGSLNIDVEAVLGDCISDPSPTIVIMLDTIPEETAFAGMDTTACQGATISLNAAAPAQSSGRWSLLNTTGNVPNIEMPTVPGTSVSGLEGNTAYALLWALSNGACENFSMDTLILSIAVPAPAIAGMDTLICPGSLLNLNAVAPGEGEGEWSQTPVQEDFNIFIDNPADPQTSISGAGLLPGNTYAFLWTVVSECGVDSSQVLVSIADNDPFAGFDQIVCDDEGLALLAAGEPAFGSTGRWSSPDPGLVFTNRNNTDTEVLNLAVGDNLIVWTLDQGLCGPDSRDTLVIDYQTPPVAQDDARTIAFAIESFTNVLLNDMVPEGATVEIAVAPANGTARVLADNQIAYTPAPDFAGTDQLVYRVCREGCACDEAVLRLTVGEGLVCEAPNVITPNGDGVNDAFIIPCLLEGNEFPNSRLSVFNRWGDEVYNSPVPYPNNWSGTFNGEDLPVDTYFYILDLGDGSQPMSGYLLIQR